MAFCPARTYVPPVTGYVVLLAYAATCTTPAALIAIASTWSLPTYAIPPLSVTLAERAPTTVATSTCPRTGFIFAM